MAKGYMQLLPTALLAAALMAIVSGPVPTMGKTSFASVTGAASGPTTAGAASGTETHAHQNKADAYAKRRSYSGTGSMHNGLTASFNGFTNLSGLQRITGSYGSSVHDSTATATSTGGKQETPIYEEQQENDYDVAIAVAAAQANSPAHTQSASTYSRYADGGSSLAGTDERHQNVGGGGEALRTAIYNLHSAGTHNGFLPSFGYGSYYGRYSSSLPWSSSTGAGGSGSGIDTSHGSISTPQLHKQPQQYLQSSDKISDGSFLQHYEHNSGYDELTSGETGTGVDTTTDQEHQHQQYFQQHFQHNHPQYFTPSGSKSEAESYEQYHQSPSPTASTFDEPTNYLTSQHAPSGPSSSQHHPDVINYVPYPVVKKLHIPVHEPVRIPVSHAVIVPISKPVPIHIPVTQQVQVPVEKELKIPVERVVPFPVEKHVPVPVEKRVPYPVIKYVPIKVPRPFPVKVPVFKTILHKIKSTW